MAASTDLSRWICVRFQILKPISAAAGSTIANSSVSSVFVRSVNRHFLDILNLVNFVTRPYMGKTIKTPPDELSSHRKRLEKVVKDARCRQHLAESSSRPDVSGIQRKSQVILEPRLGADAMQNLITLCASCHGKLTAVSRYLASERSIRTAITYDVL